MNDYKHLTDSDIKEILQAHKLWLESDGKEGEQADFSETDIVKKDLSGANLRKASFKSCNAIKADFSGADISHADLENIILASAFLMNTTLEGANLEGADLNSTFLENTNLTRTNLEGSDLESANLKRTNMTGAFLYRSDLSGIRGVDRINTEYVYVGSRENPVKLEGNTLTSWLNTYASLCTSLEIFELGRILEALEEYKESWLMMGTKEDGTYRKFTLQEAEKRIKGFSRTIELVEEAYKFGIPKTFDRKIDDMRYVVDKGGNLYQKLTDKESRYVVQYGEDNIFRLKKNIEAMLCASKKCKYLN